MNKLISVLSGAFFILAGSVVFAAQTDYFLKIDDIKGESTDVSGAQVTPSQTNILIAPDASDDSSAGLTVSDKPPIVDYFACSDNCPGSREQYMVKVYKDVTDSDECKKLGGTPSSYFGWGEFHICLAETKNQTDSSNSNSDGDSDRPVITGTVSNASKSELIKNLSSSSLTSGVYVKLGDIKGESENSASTSSGSESKSGNVEFEWKVEKGEKANKPKEIIVVGSKVRGWDPKTKEEILSVAPTNVSEVETDEDLVFFITANTLEVEVVEEVSLNYGKIKISAAIPAKLFGLVPTSIATTLVIERDSTSNSYGRVKVQFPWWHVLTKKVIGDKAIQSLYDAEIEKAGEIVVSSPEDSQQEMAQQFQILSNVMKTMHETAKSIIQNIRA